MKQKVIIFTFLISIFLVSCSNSNINGTNTSKNDIQSVKELVKNFSEREISGEITASITSQKLIVTEKDGSEVVYDLPKDEFFVSIAPYVQETHPCKNHSLTGCQGELVNEEFDVYIEDTNGNVVVDKKITSYSNGFIDLWLPRNETFSVTIKHNGKTAQTEISTFNDDGTCITTMKLK